MAAFDMRDRRLTKAQLEFKEKVIEGKMGDRREIKINTQEIFKES
jgi:hypothetical protein